MNTVNRRPVIKARREPAELLERLVELHRTARARRRVRKLELYHRSSIGIRADLDPDRETYPVRLAGDDGIAVRVLSETGKSGFAAATGSDAAAVEWALSAALEAPGSTPPRAPAWPEAGARLSDHDPPGLPETEAVESWLRSAWEGLCRTANGPAPWNAGLGRAEVAWVVESWVTDGGLSASRSRNRAWAAAQVRRCGAPPLLRRPVFTAARTWERLDAGEWGRIWADRGGTAAPAAGPAGERPLLLTPEASAEIVSALARALHGPGNPLGVPVGPGWRLVDDPTEDGAPGGVRFDDCAFATARRALADGKKTIGTVDGPGCLRRHSFRDPPAPSPFHLRVETSPVAPPPGAIHVTGVVVHAHDPADWTVEVAGPAFGAGFIRARPRDLVQRCVGVAGARCTDHRGISTPSLLLENVEIRPLDP